MSHEHSYRTTVTWAGSTGVGYELYDRRHEIALPPSAEALTVSADPAFRGNPELTNPEQLLLAAASSCQLLSFLAVAARARVDVLSYSDQAEALMPEDDLPVRITRITLRPQIVVAEGTDIAKVTRLVDLAHRECYIANTVSSEMLLEPVIETA
jgi:organic hydroperoxide reductase OsmC/OhrA